MHQNDMQGMSYAMLVQYRPKELQRDVHRVRSGATESLIQKIERKRESSLMRNDCLHRDRACSEANSMKNEMLGCTSIVDLRGAVRHSTTTNHSASS